MLILIKGLLNELSCKKVVDPNIIAQHARKYIIIWYKAMAFKIIYQTWNLGHSDRRLRVGFANAAFIAWKLTVINAIAMVSKPARANTHQLILIL